MQNTVKTLFTFQSLFTLPPIIGPIPFTHSARACENHYISDLQSHLMAFLPPPKDMGNKDLTVCKNTTFNVRPKN